MRLGDVSADLSAQLQAQFQTKLKSASGDVQAWVTQNTGINTQNQTTQQGAAAAVDLLSHGFDQNSTADKAKLIHAIAGGLAAFPPVGTAMAAYLEGLWTVGNAIGCPVSNFFSDLLGQPRGPDCGGAPCQTSGNWTNATILAGSKLPSTFTAPHPLGSFEDFVINALATMGAQAGNCKPTPNPAMVVDAVVSVWNQTHAGPTRGVWIPPLSASWVPLIPYWQNVSGCDPWGESCGEDPNVHYAFKQVAYIPWINQPWRPFVAPQMAYVYPDRVVNVNIGPLQTQKVIAINISGGVGLSTPAKVAVGVGGLAVATVGAASIYAWLTRQAVGKVLGDIWSATGGKAIRGLGR